MKARQFEDGNDLLSGSQGYQVDTHDGRIGSVAAVLPCAGGTPGYLLVHTGLLSCRLTAIPFAAVEDVNPSRRRVVLQEPHFSAREARQHDDRHAIARST